MDFRRGSLPSVVATAVARPSVQWPHSRRNVSAVDHQVLAAKKGKGKGSGQAKGVGKVSHQQAPRHNAAGQSLSVAAPKQRVPMSPDQVVEAARSRVAKLKQVLATLGEEDDMHPAVQEALSKAEHQARDQPVRERIRSTKSFVERKQKRVEQAKEATVRAREALNSAVASQKMEENLLAEGERRLAELMIEEKAIPSPFQVTPACNVNVELDHLRAEIARLRQQRERLLTSAAMADPRVGALRTSYVRVALQACRQGCRTQSIMQESVPRTSRTHRMLDEFAESCWAVFHDVDLPVLFRERFTTLQSCPQSVRGRFLQACRKALQARRDAVNAGDELMEERSWKMFCLLPCLLLHRRVNKSTIIKEVLYRRFDLFGVGAWDTLVDEAVASIPQARPTARRLWNMEDREKAACQKVKLGEITRARQCLTGAALAPGNDDISCQSHLWCSTEMPS